MPQVSKYHGLGNDFILARESLFLKEKLPALAKNICDRHTGIGADGLILVGENPLSMQYYNSDGSKAPMCGNGIRCFAKFCLDEGLVQSDVFVVHTGDGEKEVQVRSHAPFTAQVEMGKPDFSARSVGAMRDEPVWGERLVIESTEVKIYSLYMATVHTVVFVEHPEDLQNMALGKSICEHPLFSQKTNVNFVFVKDARNLLVRTYERGAGPTLACGTGACAAVVAAAKQGLCENAATVHLEKGNLEIALLQNGAVRMQGPAVRVMKGEWECD